ncbi:MAG: hypothetical protein GSR80_000049 [Desulfurococcales archaeon]|nr:hypothetical protein [Desulfurococcales archaeon]
MELRVYDAYRWGKRSSERLVEALEDILCCPGDGKCRDTLAKAAPFLVGAEDCDELEVMLDVYFAWLSLRWAYRPCGEPPSTKKLIVKRMLCRGGLPLDEEFLRELATVGEETSGLEAEAGAGVE